MLTRNPVAPAVRIEVVKGTPAVMCEGIMLLTVTPEDAADAHTDPVMLAGQWQESLQEALDQIAAERSGRYSRAPSPGALGPCYWRFCCN